MTSDDLADVVPALAYERRRDAAWTLIRVSAQGALVLGRSPGDLGPGSSLLAAVHPDDRARAEQRVNGCLADGDGYVLEYRVAGAREAWVLDRGRRVGDALFGVIVEVPRERGHPAELEARLWEAEKLDALGRLAGGVAHDFNNVLTGVLGHAVLLREQLPEGELARAASTIEAGARRAALLTEKLLGFARKGKVQNVVFDLCTVVGDALSLLESGLGEGVTVRYPPPVALAVRGDPAQVQQAVLNLAINAGEALHGRGGTVTVTVDRADLDAAEVAQHVGAQRGAYARVSVADDGPGVPEAVRSRIFEPFFTTKPEGTGMGLPMVYGIVRNHGGFVALTTAEGRGATFAAYLPLVVSSRAHESAELPIVAPEDAARILFVDDEELIRFAARAQLEGLGHQVVLARDGEEAVARFRAEGDAIDLVILDLTMPRMSGADCLRALRALSPTLPVVLSTGFGRDEAVEALMGLGVSGLLEKPYRQAELAEAIRAALA